MVSLALPYMRAQGSGRIVLFSSINGLLGIPFQSAYTASKHALEGYAECLAMETAPWGVQVCLVEPGDHRGGSQRTRLNAREENGASPYHERFDAAVAVIHSDEANGFPRTGWARNWSKMWSAGICASACAWPSRISIWRCGCTRCCLRG